MDMAQILERLKQFDTASITNVVASYSGDREGCLGLYNPWRVNWYTDQRIRCMFPQLGPRVGYAVTVRYGMPDAPFARLNFGDVLRAIHSVGAPVIVAMEQALPEPYKSKNGLSGGNMTTAQQQLCTAAGLTERHARAVLRLPESRRTAALEKIARDKLSVREADRLVDAMLAAPKDTPGPCRSTVPMVGDVRLFVNTLQHAVDLMTQRGIPAVTSCEQADGFLEYTVRIPTATPAPLPVPNTLPACHEPEMPSGEGSSLGEEDEFVRS